MSEQSDKIVATVFNKTLRFSDIKHIFPKEATKDDSATLAKMYIDKWIETQLLLNKAELNLTKEQLDISKEMETYRTSLLIYKYEDLMLHEKLDTVVFGEEIRQYYDNYSANFIMDEYAVQALLLRLSVNAPNLGNVKRWSASSKEEDMRNLTEYCAAHAVVFENFNDEWVMWQDVAKKLPQQAEYGKIPVNNRLEIQDGQTLYLLHIKERKSPGDIAPQALVVEKIKNIILNKRKVSFITNLEQKIYNDALSKNQFKIYF
ncbi:MAG: hypothetical protein LBS09_05635 [Bacteroidales bacterium]|jgi:hypothetical protein|nr:hypothetical protein [Bacteroidales bacterium]